MTALGLGIEEAPAGLEHRLREVRTRRILEARSGAAAEAPPRQPRPVP